MALFSFSLLFKIPLLYNIPLKRNIISILAAPQKPLVVKPLICQVQKQKQCYKKIFTFFFSYFIFSSWSSSFSFLVIACYCKSCPIMWKEISIGKNFSIAPPSTSCLKRGQFFKIHCHFVQLHTCKTSKKENNHPVLQLSPKFEFCRISIQDILWLTNLQRS